MQHVDVCQCRTVLKGSAVQHATVKAINHQRVSPDSCDNPGTRCTSFLIRFMNWCKIKTTIKRQLGSSTGLPLHSSQSSPCHCALHRRSCRNSMVCSCRYLPPVPGDTHLPTAMLTGSVPTTTFASHGQIPQRSARVSVETHMHLTGCQHTNTSSSVCKLLSVLAHAKHV